MHVSLNHKAPSSLKNKRPFGYPFWKTSTRHFHLRGTDLTSSSRWWSSCRRTWRTISVGKYILKKPLIFQGTNSFVFRGVNQAIFFSYFVYLGGRFFFVEISLAGVPKNWTGSFWAILLCGKNTSKNQKNTFRLFPSLTFSVSKCN